MSGAVDVLLNEVELGNQVRLAADNYEWASPFHVASIEEECFESPEDGEWRARRLSLDPDHHLADTKIVTVVSGLEPPHLGEGYGPLVGAEVIDENGSVDADDSEEGAGGGHSSDPPGKLARHASEIAEEFNVRLDRLLNIVEHSETVIDVREQLDIQDLQRVRDLLWELDLRENEVRLTDDRSWLEQLRSEYVEGGSD